MRRKLALMFLAALVTACCGCAGRAAVYYNDCPYYNDCYYYNYDYYYPYGYYYPFHFRGQREEHEEHELHERREMREAPGGAESKRSESGGNSGDELGWKGRGGKVPPDFPSGYVEAASF